MIGTDFYPTPRVLIARMLSGVSLGDVESILEPSAGKGDICEYITEQMEYHRRRSGIVDVIEINPELQHVLRGKEYRLVHDDFLTFQTHKAYDLIIANFPFSTGDQHLQKAISLLEKNGGRLICLVNAETIRNPYTQLRQAIVSKLHSLNTDVEYLEIEFASAERPTNVEVALIRLTIPAPDAPSVILDALKKAPEAAVEEHRAEQLIEADYMQALVSRFSAECRFGLALIDEYFALKPYISDRFTRTEEQASYAGELIELKVEGAYKTKASYVNCYLVGVRHKYWELLTNDRRFNSFYTSNIIEELSRKLAELKDYDFNLFNINALIEEMNSKIGAGIEKSILDLFDTFSRQYAWDQSLNEGNIHYYNGWKTNKAHKVNSKVIVPINGFSAYSKDKLDYNLRTRLNDMVKVFNYLSDEKINVGSFVHGACDKAEMLAKFTNMNMRFFETTFYKKGTCHIKFTDERLLAKFNIFGSQRKGWLPPAYGKKPYEDLDGEERAVVDDFQGKEAYGEVERNATYYLVESTAALQLQA